LLIRGYVKNHLQAGEEEEHLLVALWHVLQASNTLEVGVLGPVQREPIKKSWVRLVAANFQEFTLETLGSVLPTTPLKETHNWRSKRLASKKYRKTSTNARCPKWVQRMENLRTNAQLFGCSWAGATLISVK